MNVRILRFDQNACDQAFRLGRLHGLNNRRPNKILLDQDPDYARGYRSGKRRHRWLAAFEALVIFLVFIFIAVIAASGLPMPV